MNRNLKLSILAVAALALPACLGGYQPGQNGTPPVDNTNTGGGGGGGTAAGGGGGTGGGGSGGGGGGGTTGVTAKDMFTANVAPVLMRCSASTCHGSATLTAPTQFAYSMPTLYDNITGYSSRVLGSYDKTQATIISKITAGGHNGQTYTAAEITSIGDWLDKEHQERTVTGGTGTTDAREKLLEAWSACMTQTDFDTAGVATAWSQKRTDTTNTACQQCHVNGQGFLANPDSTRMFQILTQAPNPAGGWFLEMYFTVDMTTDPAHPKIIINKDRMTIASLGTAQHEKFSVTTDRGGATPSAYDKLTTFYNTTMTKMTAAGAAGCGTSKLGTPLP